MVNVDRDDAHDDATIDDSVRIGANVIETRTGRRTSAAHWQCTLQRTLPRSHVHYSASHRPRRLVIQDYELQALAAANTPAGMEWKRIAYDNPDSPNKGVAKMVEGFFAVRQTVWGRTDGAILWLRSGLMVRLELPVVRQYEEQAKVAKDQKARSSVPKF